MNYVSRYNQLEQQNNVAVANVALGDIWIPRVKSNSVPNVFAHASETRNNSSPSELNYSQNQISNGHERERNKT